MGMPASVFQFAAVVIVAFITTKIRRSRLIAIAWISIVAIGGCLMIKLLPKEHRLGRLAGFWLITAVAPVFPLILSLFSSNTAGFTKESVTTTFIFVGYCVGNFVGPQFFISTEAPRYEVSGPF